MPDPTTEALIAAGLVQIPADYTAKNPTQYRSCTACNQQTAIKAGAWATHFGPNGQPCLNSRRPVAGPPAAVAPASAAPAPVVPGPSRVAPPEVPDPRQVEAQVLQAIRERAQADAEAVAQVRADVELLRGSLRDQLNEAAGLVDDLRATTAALQEQGQETVSGLQQNVQALQELLQNLPEELQPATPAPEPEAPPAAEAKSKRKKS